MAAAFDAGTSDPDGREYKDLPGANSCRMNATFLARSKNLTEITLSVPGTGYHYGIYIIEAPQVHGQRAKLIITWLILQIVD